MISCKSLQYLYYTICTICVFLLYTNIAFSKDEYQSEISAVAQHKLSEEKKSGNVGQSDEEKIITSDVNMVKNDYQVQYELGLASAKEKDYINAEKHLKHAADIREKLNLNDNRVYNALGWVLFSQNKYIKAETTYLKGLDSKYNNDAVYKRIYANLGTLYYAIGNLVKARKYLSISVNRYNSKGSKKLLDQISILEKNKMQKMVFRKIDLSIQQGEYIGQKVWLNESSGDQLDSLINWNEGENHASVGIGHFIWYPKNQQDPYEETFPDLLLFLINNGVKLPQWLKMENTSCPWDSRNIMLAAEKAKDEKYLQLESLLHDTNSFQVEFMIQRLSRALPIMLASVNTVDEKNHISMQFERVARRNDGIISSDGVYALLDYVNFKGEGTNEKERYKDQGWGLLQVLEGMDRNSEDPLEEFIASAKRTLERRIKNSPPERNEEKWRKGWFRRLDTYQG